VTTGHGDATEATTAPSRTATAPTAPGASGARVVDTPAGSRSRVSLPPERTVTSAGAVRKASTSTSSRTGLLPSLSSASSGWRAGTASEACTRWDTTSTSRVIVGGRPVRYSCRSTATASSSAVPWCTDGAIWVPSA
jgi:hypothetical protein